MSNGRPLSLFRSAMAPERPLYLNLPLWRHQYEPISKLAENIDQQPPDVIAAAAMAYLASFPDRDSLLQGVRAALDHYGRLGKHLKLDAEFEWPKLPRAKRGFDASKL